MNASILTGLTAREASIKARVGLHNRLRSVSSRSLWHILQTNVFTLFNGIVLACFLLLVLLGQWRDALFGSAAITNSVIGVIQEYRAKRLLDRLSILNAARARVLRDGTVQELTVAEVVQDDILVVRSGDQVAADAVVIDGDGLQLDESLLTGESEPVDKPSGAEILSGSFVVAGHGRACVVRVGEASYSNHITLEAKRFTQYSSEIRNSLNGVLRWITWTLLPITLLVANGQMQAYGGWEHALSSGAWATAVVGVVASLIAMVPLGLVLISSIAFAMGGIRLARMRVLVQELPALEGLARVDVICVDKTGTLTDGAMVYDAAHTITAMPAAGWQQALGWFGADPHANTTARCLAHEFPPDDSFSARSSIPFSSDRKWSAVTFARDSSAPGTWVLGAAEFILSPGSGDTDHAFQVAADLAASGLRTLVLAHSPDIQPETHSAPASLAPVTLITFREHVRPDAARTLAYFHEEGVEVKVLSGDDPLTVAAVAREVGLHADSGVDARKLPEDLDQLGEAVKDKVVFGRVTPYQKRDIVRALQRSGHVVAMTGDGINDVLAMKEADIGIAMDSAAAATKAVSRLVLLDGRFDRLPSVVAEGRRVIANIERLAMLALSKVVYILIVSTVYGVLLWGFPLLPRQLSVTDGLTVGIPSLFLALMPNSNRYVPGFMKRSVSFAVPAGAVIAAALIAVGIVARSRGYLADATQTSLVITLSLLALWVLVVLSRPFKLRGVLIVTAMYSGLILLLLVPVIRDFFNIPLPPPELLMTCLVVSLLGCAGIETVYRTNRFTQQARP